MACYSPLTGWRSRHVSPSGKRKIVFSKSAGYLDMPVSVPCGVCIGCRIDHSRQWALRCVHESKLHDRNCFITLTYDDDHLPENGTLVKKHLQDFFKRLRKRIGKFRYFASGEYGDSNHRPHYHAILFGVDFSFDRKKHSKNSLGDILHESKTASSTWGNGFVTIGNFSYSTAAYVARYVIKKYRGKHPDLHYKRLNVTTGEEFQLYPEFSCMSLKPGIGSGWYDKFSSDVFPDDFCVSDGKMHSVPKYYTNRLQERDPKLYKAIKDKRRKSLLSNVDQTPDRRYVREVVKISQISNLKRSL